MVTKAHLTSITKPRKPEINVLKFSILPIIFLMTTLTWQPGLPSNVGQKFHLRPEVSGFNFSLPICERVGHPCVASCRNLVAGCTERLGMTGQKSVCFWESWVWDRLRFVPEDFLSKSCKDIKMIINSFIVDDIGWYGATGPKDFLISCGFHEDGMYDGLDRAICSHQSAPRLPDGMKGQGEREIGHL